MYNGVIATSLYGGSNIKGTIYGDVNILMAGGEISNSLYGGGKGGVSTNNPGTYVRDDVNVVIGNDTILQCIWTSILYTSILQCLFYAFLHSKKQVVITIDIR